MALPLANVQVHFVNSIEEAVECINWLRTIPLNQTLAFDTETTGLEKHVPGAKVRLVQVGYGDHGWAIPAETWGGLVEQIFREWRGDLVAHNLSFDANFMKLSMGIDVLDRPGTCHDTSLFSHLINPHQSHKLKYLSDRYVQQGASAGETLLSSAMNEQGWTWATVPVTFHIYWAYGALDAVITWKLFEIWKRDFAWIFESMSYQLEAAVAPCYARMEMSGMRCDMEYIGRMDVQIAEYCTWADGWLKETYQIENRQSNSQVATALLEHGAQLTEKTGTGLWKLDKDIIKSIHEPPHAKAIAEMVGKTRKMTKMRSTFFGSLSEWNHPEIRQCGAMTGRSSVTSPPMQQIPNGPAVRTGFLAQPGHLIVTSDLDQVEPRVAANISGDLAFQEAIMSGDLYTTAARVVYNDDSIQKDSPYRKLMKVGILARLYGAGAEGLATQLGITEAGAHEFVDRFASSYPTLDAYVTDLIGQCTRNGGWVMSPFGRRFRVQYPGSEEFKIMNYMMQGTAAEILKLNVIALDAAGYGPNMMMVVHDEVVMSIPAVEAETARTEVEACMTFRGEQFGWKVPCTASSDIGPTWGTKYLEDPAARGAAWDKWWNGEGQTSGLTHTDFLELRAAN